MQEYLGVTQVVSGVPVRILIDPRDDLPAYTRRSAILDVLLHEVCHCFFQEYSCRCETCSKSMGKTGHAAPWQDLALAVEEAANQYSPIPRFTDQNEVQSWDLKRQGSYLFEKLRGGEWPSPDQGIRWFG